MNRSFLSRTLLIALPVALLSQSPDSEELVSDSVQPKQRGDVEERIVHVVTVSGVIGPISSEFILKSIHEGEEKGIECLIIQLDTPGGLMEAMRDIVKGLLGADIPVVVYMAPIGEWRPQ
ncbi:MAG: hypothetical protein V3U24_09470 [Candidatus Neomarinimicrobiota bacterium]